LIGIKFTCCTLLKKSMLFIDTENHADNLCTVRRNLWAEGRDNTIMKLLGDIVRR